MKVNDILKEGIRRDASDVHIVCILPPLVRVNGELTRLNEFGNITPDISEKILFEIINQI